LKSHNVPPTSIYLIIIHEGTQICNMVHNNFSTSFLKKTYMPFVQSILEPCQFFT
jgi:hypothetical protein